TPGRADEEVALFSKADYKEKNQESGHEDDLYHDQALGFLEALGGAENIDNVNNCATRLRVSVKDEKKVQDDAAFKAWGAHGVVRNNKYFQIIVGLNVPQVRESFDQLVDNDE
ncbi:glucose PTS transporter subunit EIIB, partial [Tetragenococcus halophilus]